MWDAHDKLQYRNNYNHWKILDLVLDLNYFSFTNPHRTHLPKPWALTISFLSVSDVQSIYLRMRTWQEVRNVAWYR